MRPAAVDMVRPEETPGNGDPNRPDYLYETIYQRLLQQIRSGVWPVGSRMPSVRRLSRMFGVSINTVVHSYRKLEADGILEARPQSGYFLRRCEAEPQLRPGARPGGPFPLLPVEVSLSERVLESMALHADEQMVKLGIALPSPEVLPVQRVLRLLRTVTRTHPIDAWNYTHPQGHDLLVRCLARRSLTHAAPVTPDDVIVTTGCMEALAIALRCVSRPGDAIAVESPTYYGALLLLEVNNRRVVEIPATPSEGICLNTLERVMARGDVSACMVSANAQNPLGFTMPEANKRRLAELSARYRTPLIENDVWGDTVFDAATNVPVKAYDRDGYIIYCNSFSKTLIPGFRIGWALPGRFHRRFRELKQLTTITSASAPQQVIGQLMESGFYEQHLRELRKRLRRQVWAHRREVLRCFPAGTQVDMPSGGCVLWVRLPEGTQAQRLADEAAAQGVHVFPGSVFCADGRLDAWLRISAGNPMDARIRKGIAILGRLARAQQAG